MLIVFRSKAAAEIYMFAQHAKALLEIVGKPFEPPEAPKGIITADQVSEALAKLKRAVEASKAEHTGESEETTEQGAPISVSLAQRAYPLVDMLERAAKAPADVTWGV